MLKGWTSNHASTSDYIPLTRDGKPSLPPNQLKLLIIRLIPTAFIFALGILLGTCYPSYLSIYTRKPLQISSLLPIELPPPPGSLLPPVPSLPPSEEPVPNIVHYVFGLDTTSTDDFPYFAYLAMRSAMMVLRPEHVLFHCVQEPRGHWWDRVRDWEGWTDGKGQRKGMVELVKARDVQTIGKDRRPVHHYAHKADILRLEILSQYGGIYLDIDTFIIRPFASASLMSYDTVLGMEARGLDFIRGIGSDIEMDPKGLCNAVIIARPGATFLERWLRTYDSFDERQWTAHSVEMPWNLAKLYPTTVTILSDRAFFWPLWTKDHIKAVFDSTEYDFAMSGQLAYHAWESKAKPYLSVLDPTTIRSIDTSFTRMAKKYREAGEERRWKIAKEKEAASRTAIQLMTIGERRRKEWGKLRASET